MKTRIVVLLVSVFFVLACGIGAPRRTPTPRPTPTIAAVEPSTPFPDPTETAVPAASETPGDSLEATLPAEGSVTPGVVLPEPKGTPARTWNDFPVMPGAIAGEADGQTTYTFTIKSTPDKIQAYYEKELAKQGWSLLGSGDGAGGNLMLIFQKDTDVLSVMVIDPKTEDGVLEVMMVK